MDPRYTQWEIVTVFVTIAILILTNSSEAVIVFKASPTGKSDIYVMNDNGEDVRQLTKTPLSEHKPRLSPDGKYILFTRKPSPQSDIFIMDADGSNERRLTHHRPNDTDPCWSPDGKQIAFTSTIDGAPNIHIMKLANGNIRQLTKSIGGKTSASMPSWSPDGQHIVHQLVIGVKTYIYITDIDGKNTRPFLHGPQPHIIDNTVISRHHPLWSPDGKHVMYFEDRMGFDGNRAGRLASHLIVVDKNGKHPKKLDIPEDWVLYSACWAANGAEILFSAAEEGWDIPININQHNYNIYRYHLLGGKITQIANTPTNDLDPHWVPGTFSVSPAGKLNVQWGEIKEEK
jgi:Tol biopolymer transport system component